MVVIFAVLTTMGCSRDGTAQTNEDASMSMGDVGVPVSAVVSMDGDHVLLS